MNRKEIINHRQMAWLIATILTAGGFVSLQSELVRISRMDAWSSYILPILYAFAVCFVLYYLAKKFPGKNLFQIAFALGGKWIGGIINVLFIFHLWTNMLRGITSFADFFKTALLPETPRDILILVFILLMVYFGRIGIESTCRTNDIFFPLFAIMTIFLPIALANEVDFRLIEPILIGPVKSLLSSNLLAVGWYGDIFVAGAFLHTLASSREIRSSLRHGVVLGSLLLLIFIVLEIAVLGTRITSNLLYPNFSLVQQIHITDFLDRVDLFMLGVWFFIICCKSIFIYLAFLIAVQSFSKDTTYQLFNKPCAMFILITTTLAFHNVGSLFNFGNYGAITIVLAYQPIVFLFLLLRAKMKKFANQEQQAGAAEGDGQADRQDDSQMSDGEKKTYRKTKVWGRVTNLALLAAFAFLGMGILMGHIDTLYGKIACIGCGLCLLSLWLTTYKEMKWSVRHALK